MQGHADSLPFIDFNARNTLTWKEMDMTAGTIMRVSILHTKFKYPSPLARRHLP